MRNKKEDFESLLKKGIAVDLLEAERHYFVFKLIGKNYDQVNKKDQSHRKQSLVYLQNASQELAILNLSRVFDRKNNRYQVRCLDFIIDECININSEYFLLDTECYPAFKRMSDASGIELNDHSFESKEDLVILLKKILRSKSIVSSIKNLHTIRDKYVAHNEHNPKISSIESFWDDFPFLLHLGKLYLSVIGEIFAGQSFTFTMQSEIDEFSWETRTLTSWIADNLIEYLGEDKVKFI